jgi:hypothetical protein
MAPSSQGRPPVQSLVRERVPGSKGAAPTSGTANGHAFTGE